MPDRLLPMEPIFDVLVVDDDFMVAGIHRRFVDQVPGFRTVAVAHTVAEALSMIVEHEPQLVLLDVYLPDGSGLDVLRQLRADGRQTAVIMITAARELDSVTAALHGGANEYLVKPFEASELRARLEAFAGRMRLLGATGTADQSTIDAVFQSGRGQARASLPKGMSAETGALVLRSVREHGETSAAECAEAVGLSRVSARRYLEHFLSTGALEIRLQYGKAGRPERRYRAP